MSFMYVVPVMSNTSSMRRMRLPRLIPKAAAKKIQILRYTHIVVRTKLVRHVSNQLLELACPRTQSTPAIQARPPLGRRSPTRMRMVVVLRRIRPNES